MKNVLQIIAAVIVMGLVNTFIVNLVRNPEQSSLSKANTSKNSFISGCKGEAGDYSANFSADIFCGCAYDKLTELHGKGWTDDEVTTKRILNEGYNSIETDAVVGCFTKAKIEVN